jgi:hypothetical protein
MYTAGGGTARTGLQTRRVGRAGVGRLRTLHPANDNPGPAATMEHLPMPKRPHLAKTSDAHVESAKAAGTPTADQALARFREVDAEERRAELAKQQKQDSYLTAWQEFSRYTGDGTSDESGNGPPSFYDEWLLRLKAFFDALEAVGKAHLLDQLRPPEAIRDEALEVVRLVRADNAPEAVRFLRELSTKHSGSPRVRALHEWLRRGLGEEIWLLLRLKEEGKPEPPEGQAKPLSSE